MLGFILHFIKIMPISDGIIESIIGPLGIGLIAGGAQALFGGIQALTAGPKVEQKPYERPKEYDQAFQESMDLSRQGMDESSKRMAEQAAQQAAIFSLRGSQDRRGGLAALANIQAQMDRSSLSIAAQDAAIRQRNRLLGIQALENFGRRKDIEFQTESQRLQNLELQRRARIGAGFQNMFRGFDFMGSIAAMGGLGVGATKTTIPTTPTTTPTTTFTTTPATGATASVSPRLLFGSTYQYRPPELNWLPKSIKFKEYIPSIGLKTN